MNKNMMGMIKSYIGFNNPISVKRHLYLARVRNILEHCSLMWNPSRVKDIIKLEWVQLQVTNIFSIIMLHHITNDAQNYLSCLFASVEK